MFLTALLFSLMPQGLDAEISLNAIDQEYFEAFTQTAMKNLQRETPREEPFVYKGQKSVVIPKSIHPTFYGAYDWHSAVHNHWLLVRLIRTNPTFDQAEVREFLDQQFSQKNLDKEAEFFHNLDNAGYEEPYGWAWLLFLAAELRDWDDKDAAIWSSRLEPLEKNIVNLFSGYIQIIPTPNRIGAHQNTAFSLSLFLDYARSAQNHALEKSIIQRAKDFYLDDINYPFAYDSSVENFLSPGLCEADLMRRALPPKEFSNWLSDFFPGLEEGKLDDLLKPAKAYAFIDPYIVYSAGLNFSKAWALEGIVRALPNADPRITPLLDSAILHRATAMDFAVTGVFLGDHWLPSFAVYLLSDAGI